MSKDTRGTPGRNVQRVQHPKLKLADLLRRRRTTLKQFILDLGVSTHAALEIWCYRMGVTSPTVEDFNEACPIASKVNSPLEGIVVLNAPNVIDESSGSVIDPEAPITAPGVYVITDPSFVPFDEPTKKLRKKKEATATDE